MTKDWEENWMFALEPNGSVIIVWYHCKNTIFSMHVVFKWTKDTLDISKCLDICKTNYQQGEDWSPTSLSKPEQMAPIWARG